ncbi:MAG: glycosyltransferase family 2 protein [Opitutae bacterium]|nr:glycosyltransferase family 2 protein [Opitutae bacterium]
MSEPAVQVPRVLVVIPCFNEGKSIRGVLEQIRALDERVDTLVVDDGSRDDTSDQARPLSRCVRLVMNLGIGGAVQTGYRYARENNYDFCIQVDGDGQHPPDQILVLLAAARATGANLMIGSRFLSGQGFRSTRARRVGIRLISMACRFLFGLKVSDPTSGFRLCDRRAISLFADQYPQDFPEPVSIGYARAAGLKVEEAPVRMIERTHGSSSITGFKNLAYMLRVLGNLVLIRLDSNA